VEPLETRRLLSFSHASPDQILHPHVTGESEIRTYGSPSGSGRLDSKPIASNGLSHRTVLAVHGPFHGRSAHAVGGARTGAAYRGSPIGTATQAEALSGWRSLDRIVQTSPQVEPMPTLGAENTTMGGNGPSTGPPGGQATTGGNGASAGAPGDQATAPGSPGTDAPLPDPSSLGQPLPIRVLETGGNTKVWADQLVVIRDQATWQSFYAENVEGLSPSAPPVDFPQEMVVAIVMNAPTGGYGVTIDSVTATQSQVTVSYTEFQPDPDSLVFEELTQPYVFVAVPTTDPSIPVVFQGTVNYS
jgi:hypothetical protein